MRVIDLTHTITEDMPVYPGTEPPRLIAANSYERDGFRETRISMHSHTGTHLDPPAHLFRDGTTLDALPPDRFIGKALSIDCRDLAEGEPITLRRLEPYGKHAEQVDFLLFCLGWDARWGTERYFADYPCLDDALLAYILRGRYKGIGFDVIGLDPIADASLPRHKKLLARNDMINIENLTHLDQCGTEPFHFSCFPLKIKDSDGAPARAVAWFDE